MKWKRTKNFLDPPKEDGMGIREWTDCHVDMGIQRKDGTWK